MRHVIFDSALVVAACADPAPIAVVDDTHDASEGGGTVDVVGAKRRGEREEGERAASRSAAKTDTRSTPATAATWRANRRTPPSALNAMLVSAR